LSAGTSIDVIADLGAMLEEANVSAMSSYASLSMAVIMIMGISVIVFARAARCSDFIEDSGSGTSSDATADAGEEMRGSIVVLARVACWSDFTDGLGSARHGEDTVGFEETPHIAKAREARSHSLLVRDAEWSLAATMAVSTPSGCEASHFGSVRTARRLWPK